MKYAFKEKDNGLITLSVTLNKDLVSILIKDNGIGMPKDLNLEGSNGFGLKLVKMITQQLKGTIKIESNEGTKILIEFKK